MKRILLVLVLLPFLGFGQTVVDLASWSLTSNGDMTANQTYVTPGNGSFATTQSTTYNSSGVLVGGWGDGNDFYDYRYFELSISPTAGNVIWISSLLFQQARITNSGNNGPSNYTAKYFISENGSTLGDFYNQSTTLIPEESISSNNSKNVQINQSLNPNQKLIIRFYAKGGNSWNGDIGWGILANSLKFTGYKLAPLNGTYIIGSAAGADFPNITAAVNRLNGVGVSGPVKFLIDEDQTLTSQITINQFDGSSTTNTVTIKPNVNREIKIIVNKLNGSTGVPAVFLFNGTKNIIIDGSNSTLPTKNLELINNDDLNYLFRSIIWIASNSAIPSSNIIIKNSKLKFSNRTDQNNLLAAVYSGNNLIGSSNTIAYGSSTAANSKISIINNEFINVKEGVHINDDSDVSKRSVDWSIQNNKMTGGTADVDKLSRGIYVLNSTNFTISNNIISGVLRYTNAGNTPAYQTAGICVLGESSGVIDGNTIDDVTNINYASDGAIAGIFLNTNTGTTVTVSNNIISKIYSGATDSNDWNYYYKGFGIYVKSGGTTNLYYNTVVMNHSGAGGLTSCLYLEGGTTFNIRNNIFYNTQPNTQYGVFTSNSVGVSNINNISNNAYYVTNASGNFSNRLGGTSYTGTTGFSDWKTDLVNKDAASIIKLPIFVSSVIPTDFHLQDVIANSPLKAGTPISGITTDIDLNPRAATIPYMGADEIFACVAPSAAGTIIGTAAVCQGQSNIGYSVPLITNAVSYAWSYSGTGATITNETTNIPTITFSSSATSGNLTVYGVNTCGNGTVSANYAITVNPRPTPSFTTVAQAQTCADQHMTYATQSGFSNYVWTVSGVLNTDYRLIARGASTNHDIVIEWITGGSKTVTVNYNNSNGCNGASPAIYTTNVTVIDRGRVIGGAHICKGNSLPTLTLRNDAGNSIYPDSSVVLKWQYSDDLNNATWHDIPGTAGQTSYTPAAFLGAFRTYQVILQNGNCAKTSIESRINIDAFNAPTFGIITNPTCTVSTGSIVLNNLPAGNWTINQTGAATTNYSNTTANTTSYTINGLAAGTYTFTVNEGNCTSDPSTINLTQAANTWDGTKWSKTNDTTLPVADDSIIFEGNYTVSSDLTACSCTVNSGNVRVSAGRTLNITNAVTVNGGTLTFENNASLVQINDLNNNIGSIIYKRNSQPMKNFDYTYWSSPVEGQTFNNFSPNTLWDKYLSYTGTGWQEELGSSVMEPGIGYIIRVPKPNSVYPNGKDYWTGSSYTQQVEFIGRPNNGNITSSQYLEKDQYYLIGNPYPSAIHADDFLYSNVHNRGILGGTVYLWTHNTAIKIVDSRLAYVSDDYASYNLTGGTATRPALSPGANTEIPEGYIAAGQSFFASAEDGSGNVEFTNSMRYGGTHNGQFFKPGRTSRSAGLEKHRLWLNMTNAGGLYKQTLIGYIEGATNTYDKIFDGLTFDGNSYADFYSVNAADNLTIQGRGLPFTDTDVVPLGYRSAIAGDFTIAIDKADGNLSTQRVYLEDKQTGTINELTAGNYTFATKAGTFNNRFVLRYTNKTLGTGDFETTEDAVWVVIQNKTVTINSTVENIDKVFVYDISGKQLYSKDDVKNLQLIMHDLPFAQQVLLVKVVLENGYQTTKKVIFK